MSGDAGVDRAFLKETAYGDDSNLAARQAIYRYQVKPGSFFPWALAQAEWHGGGRVVDVGCGRGQYLARVAADREVASLVGCDLSTGMLTSVRRGWPEGLRPPTLVNADAESLPLADASVDVALAMHMLYHVPDIPRAIAELRRIVRPGGTLLVSANGPGGMAELYRLRWESIDAVAGRNVERWSWFARFNLENGHSLLESSFEDVQRRLSERELRIPEPEPVVAFLDSQALPAGVVPSDVDWSEVVVEMRRRAAERIAKEGFFGVTIRMGVLICR
ncbi:MAG: class I SAM-dependent methyltransferase [Acidimicrobiia bacterium]|nr:class I SAM-dependent methyltransferase [Acidimicrobiia bacterium]